MHKFTDHNFFSPFYQMSFSDSDDEPEELSISQTNAAIKLNAKESLLKQKEVKEKLREKKKAQQEQYALQQLEKRKRLEEMITQVPLELLQPEEPVVKKPKVSKHQKTFGNISITTINASQKIVVPSQVLEFKASRLNSQHTRSGTFYLIYY